MADELWAAPRDASWYDTPGTNGGRFHVATDDQQPFCGQRTMLLWDDRQPASEVEEWLRCRRPGCRQRWPKAEP